jgi:hypothetical protein
MDMKARALATLSVLALAAVIAPLPALPANNDVASYDLSTREFDLMSAGEYDGRLRLRISPDGIVGGKFMNSEGRTSMVTGGLNGTKIWLELGNSSAIGHRTYNGTFVDGKIEATAPGRRLHDWTLEATPRTHY